MNETETLKILKQAILMEKRGQVFYRKAAAEAQNPAVKDFFNLMADEEETHIKVLSEQFRRYQADSNWQPSGYSAEEGSKFAEAVITEDFQERVAAADFEAAAISAAMSMEKQAMQLYRQRAETAEEADEKALYSWLADWESHHYSFLADMDRALTEKVWFDNNFWPF